MIRYVPNNYTILWSTAYTFKCVGFEAFAWAPAPGNILGKCNITRGSVYFSADKARLSLFRFGCDDVPGSGLLPNGCGICGNKVIKQVQCGCDGVPGSDAVFGKYDTVYFWPQPDSGNPCGRPFHFLLTLVSSI